MAQAQVLPSETNERRLAAAVFQMALQDLRGDHPVHRRSALAFLFREKADFSFWCQRLDVDPSAFRERLLERTFGSFEGLSGLTADCSIKPGDRQLKRAR